MWHLLSPVALMAVLSPAPAVETPVRVSQTVHDYFTPLGAAATADDRGTYGTAFTHLGTDFGPLGPANSRLGWEPGGWVRADLRGAGGWAGMWHALAGRAADDDTLDFQRLYPPEVADRFQPAARAVTLRARGVGRVRVEVQAADRKVLWQRVAVPDGPPRDFTFDVDPAELRRAKFLNWWAEDGSDVAVDAVGLTVEYPPQSFADRLFVASYAKLSRCAVPGAGLVKDMGHRPAGAFECVPASGMYALAAAAAADRGVVSREFARQVLADTRQALAVLPTADGWLPHFVSRGPAGRYRIHPRTEYSTIDTSLAYHGLLLAARTLGDADAEADVLRLVRRLKFDKLRDPDGYLRMGFRDDGKAPLIGSWRDWGGEAALVALIERLALGDRACPRVSRSGVVPDGVGFVAEIQSLFYPQFDRDEPDHLTGVNWLRVRRALACEQAAAVADNPRSAAAARLGLYGLSAGESFRGRGYVADGTRRPADVLHPHYLLMSGQSAADPGRVLGLLRELDRLGLVPPWGLPENVSADLTESLPAPGALNAAFESLAAYHLLCRLDGTPNAIYTAARTGPPAEAVRAFYPE